MKNLDPEALIDPSASPQTVAQSLQDVAPAAKIYSYQPLDASNADCKTAGSQCVSYTLTATYEGTYNVQTTDVKKNLD